MPALELCNQQFLIVLEGVVRSHHALYHQIPPQGIYFEALVQEAFNRSRIPFTVVEPTNRNVPKHDIMVGDARLSLKTETGESTNPNHITITKLCTTERDPWEANALVGHVMRHLSGYDYILMLRAIWDRPVIHYQLLDIPVELLRLIQGAQLLTISRRQGGRQSLGADIFQDDRRVFRVHFDGSDGKCTIRRLPVAECQMLHTWDIQI